MKGNLVEEAAAELYLNTYKDRDTGVGPDRDTGVGPDRDTGVGPDRDTGVGPGRDTGVGPDRDTGVGPDRDMGVGPDRDTGVGPDRDTGVGPDRDTGVGSDRDTGVGPGCHVIVVRYLIGSRTRGLIKTATRRRPSRRPTARWPIFGGVWRGGPKRMSLNRSGRGFPK